MPGGNLQGLPKEKQEETRSYEEMETAWIRICACLSLTTGMLTGAQAAVSKETLNEAVQDTAEYMYRTVQNPQVGSIGGEWAVLGLARSGYDVPDSYYQDYYATVEPM